MYLSKPGNLEKPSAANSIARFRNRQAWRGPVVVFGLCLAVYMVDRPHPEVDTVTAPYTAFSLARWGSFDIHYPQLRYLLPFEVRELEDGRWISMRPVGSALAALPFVAPLAWYQETPPAVSVMLYLGKVAAACCVALAAAIFFSLCLRLVPAGAVA